MRALAACRGFSQTPGGACGWQCVPTLPNIPDAGCKWCDSPPPFSGAQQVCVYGSNASVSNVTKCGTDPNRDASCSQCLYAVGGALILIGACAAAANSTFNPAGSSGGSCNCDCSSSGDGQCCAGSGTCCACSSACCTGFGATLVIIGSCGLMGSAVMLWQGVNTARLHGHCRCPCERTPEDKEYSSI